MPPPSREAGREAIELDGEQCFLAGIHEIAKRIDSDRQGTVQNAISTECPLIAIIRGVTPDEAEAIGEAIYRRRHPDHRGAAELARPAEEHRAAGREASATARWSAPARCSMAERCRRTCSERAGGIIVSPNTNPEVIARDGQRAGLVSCPGYFTPSEAFAAIARRRDRAQAVSGRRRFARGPQGAAAP